MKSTILSVVILVSLLSGDVGAHNHYNRNSSGANLTGIEMPGHPSFDYVSSSSGDNGCIMGAPLKTETLTIDQQNDDQINGMSNNHAVKIQLKLRTRGEEIRAKDSLLESTIRDMTRIQILDVRIAEKNNQNSLSSHRKTSTGSYNRRNLLEQSTKKPVSTPVSLPPQSELSGQLMATLESGVSLGSGEYFMDVFIGTPPKHFSLILDTGSDLNWIQCVPCYDCFEQYGPYYNPKDSSSFHQIGCHDNRCRLVSSPDPPQPCTAENQTCPYYYWYGDSSNSTGDFAMETFTVNLTSSDGKSEFKQVKNLMFGCGHWNRGLFHGAAGLLGLGRGPLSFSSQLQSLHGHSFSYCLVDRNSDINVSSKLIFGEDKDLLNSPNLNFTSFVTGKKNQVDTFYYVDVKSILVGGEVVDIPEETWTLSSDGGGGTIIDSGTTLSYFADPAYHIIKEAFVKKVKNYALVKDFPILNPCYNVSGLESFELPEFGILFKDGTMWNFPAENYFIKFEPEPIICLAILGTPRLALSIIGNYQQQNFHILYDTKKSRLGFAPTRCADL